MGMDVSCSEKDYVESGSRNGALNKQKGELDAKTTLPETMLGAAMAG